jgi:hypothetical protein
VLVALEDKSLKVLLSRALNKKIRDTHQVCGS